MTAATHGLEAEAEQLRDALDASGQPVPDVNPSATLLQPPVPIAKTEHNWPLLVVSKVRHELDRVIYLVVLRFYLKLGIFRWRNGRSHHCFRHR